MQLREYAFLKQPIGEPLGAGKLHEKLKEVIGTLESVTIATHTHPWLVIVRVYGGLSDEECNRVRQAIEAA